MNKNNSNLLLKTFKKNSSMNILRLVSLVDFSEKIKNLNHIQRVAIVGGSIMDAEVDLLKNTFDDITFVTYGIEDSDVYLDLNQTPLPQSQYDLVLCTNVIEHIYNHENFSLNLQSLLNQGAYLWCAFPCNDRFHGAPDYFAAGFSPKYVSSIFGRIGLKVIDSGINGSQRLEYFNHVLKDWPDVNRYNHPFLGFILWHLGFSKSPRPPIRGLFSTSLIKSMFAIFFSKKILQDLNYGGSGWVFARNQVA